MKTNRITEFVKFDALQTTTNEQLSSVADLINFFLQKQDGFLDCELIKAVDGPAWCFIYHFQNMEKLKEIGAKLREQKLFDQVAPLIVTGSMQVLFYEQLKNW